MNYKISFVLIAFTAFAFSTYAQIKEKTQFTPPTVQLQFTPTVQKVVIGVDSLKSNGDMYFSAVIISTGRGMVHYQWILTAQQTTPNAPAQAIKNDSIFSEWLRDR